MISVISKSVKVMSVKKTIYFNISVCCKPKGETFFFSLIHRSGADRHVQAWINPPEPPGQRITASTGGGQDSAETDGEKNCSKESAQAQNTLNVCVWNIHSIKTEKNLAELQTEGHKETMRVNHSSLRYLIFLLPSWETGRFLPRTESSVIQH